MKESYVKKIIHSNTEIAKNIYEMKIDLGETFKTQAKPGQFYMVRDWQLEPFLSRPLSISDISNKIITFLYEAKGKGTDLLAQLKAGDGLEILGPLGNGFDLEVEGKIALVSGGIGLAPMIYLMKTLENEVDFYGGFRDEVYYIDEIEKHVDKLYISTEDGSTGHKGFVTELLQVKEYDYIITCGPTPMMKKLVEICEKEEVPLYMSMEGRMACGFGACLGCTVETSSGIERICKEGPVFLGEEVVLGD